MTYSSCKSWPNNFKESKVHRRKTAMNFMNLMNEDSKIYLHHESIWSRAFQSHHHMEMTDELHNFMPHPL
jgi:hypothetical protein